MGAVYDVSGNPIVESGTPVMENLTQIPPVPLSTVNAMLRCAFTYIEACRAGNLVYGDGTGVHQAEGKICCSTFCRQLLQGIPYNDYLPASATGTTASGQRWRYGYRMIGEDYYANDSTATAQVMYNTFRAIGRAFPSDNDILDAMPGDMIVFGSSVSSITHIGMFVYRDMFGTPYIIDSSPSNGDLAIRVHQHTRTTAVGIIRPNLTEAPVFGETAQSATVSGGSVSVTEKNGYAIFLTIAGSVSGGSAVTVGTSTYTPRYSGQQQQTIIIPGTQDQTSSVTVSGMSNATSMVSNYIV